MLGSGWRRVGNVVGAFGLLTAVLIGTGVAPVFSTAASGQTAVWTSTEGPLPGNVASNPNAEVLSIACPTAGSCIAVGTYGASDGSQLGVIDTLSDGSWTTIMAPEPANAADGSEQNASLQSVSCSTVGSCTAVGDYVGADRANYGLIDTLSGATWIATEAPEPANATAEPDTLLAAVSCASDGSCAVVGTYEDTTGLGRGLIDTFSGGSWTAVEAPEPTDSGGDQTANLDSVSCLAGTFC
jgi:hypothetical protein